MLPEPTVVKPVHFRFGDALRMIAIISVVLSHVVMVIPFLSVLEPCRLALGSWGVDAFFVLSGFLLGRPYIDALLNRVPFPSWKKYATRRFFRIWPAYAAVVLFAFAKSTLHHGLSAHVSADTLTHLLMIHNLFPAFVEGADNISLWTMAVDAQFYVILPVVAWLLYRRSTRAGNRDVIMVLAVAIAISLIWRIALPLYWPDAKPVLVIERNVIGMGTCFAVGAYLAYLAAKSIVCPRRFALPFICVAVVITIVDYITAAMAPEAAPLKEFALDCFGTAAVAITIFAIPSFEWHPFEVFLRSRVVAIAAGNAYALYLVHVPIKQTVDSFLVDHRIAEHTGRYGISFVLLFCLCCAIAVPLLHYFVELPFLTLKERAREIPIATPA